MQRRLPTQNTSANALTYTDTTATDTVTTATYGDYDHYHNIDTT